MFQADILSTQSWVRDAAIVSLSDPSAILSQFFRLTICILSATNK